MWVPFGPSEPDPVGTHWPEGKGVTPMVARSTRRGFTSEQAAAVVGMLDVDLTDEGIELEAFRKGMEVELEHGSRDPRTNVTDDDPILTGKIALAHLRELPDYYARLEEMEHHAASTSVSRRHRRGVC
jgi:Protein of unknown function (DUF5661)